MAQQWQAAAEVEHEQASDTQGQRASISACVHALKPNEKQGAASWSMVAVVSMMVSRITQLSWGWAQWTNCVVYSHAQRQHEYQMESVLRVQKEATAEAHKALAVSRDVLDHKQKILARELVRLRKQEGAGSSSRGRSLTPSSPGGVIDGI
eukprot:TRINITY_DN13074_c0_g1_i1.p1 TRINITY_DN13074_c0_g1~~TRINITY_DN13074_c0_g1_i1.p1  ORF type:complete len:151 (-),score=27.87 TRINITY_DN13074_c0_g1_i1:342-794(-)